MTDDLTTEATKQGLEQLRDWVNKLTGPTAIEIGETFGLLARGYRMGLAIKMLQKTRQQALDAGIDPKAIPPRLFLPILENASVENDDSMCDRWASLLVNASADPNAVHPSFIEILKQLTPEDAQLLDKLYDHCHSSGKRTVQPWVRVISLAERERRMAHGEDPERSFQNLIRLGLIQPKLEVKNRDSAGDILNGNTGPTVKQRHEMTEVAVRFVKACRSPKTIDCVEAKVR